ncbi:unnamed protein product [Closterium sp. Naga37s-1]|nr:unnamed protein product [Closterium sp. Naga37s-1]
MLHPCPNQPTSGSFSPSTFAAALSVCLILVFTVAVAVCVIRRLKWFEINLDSGPAADRPHPRVIWVRHMDQKPAVPGLDRATIRSFPVFTYRGSDGLDGLGSDGLLMAEDSRSGYPAPCAENCGGNCPENHSGSQTGDHVAITVASDSATLCDDDVVAPVSATNNAATIDSSSCDSLPRRPGRAERLTRECAVCLGEYAAGERIKVVPACAHGFHADCIDLWLAAKTTCPICRRDLTPVKASSPSPPFPPSPSSSPRQSHLPHPPPPLPPPKENLSRAGDDLAGGTRRAGRICRIIAKSTCRICRRDPCRPAKAATRKPFIPPSPHRSHPPIAPISAHRPSPPLPPISRNSAHHPAKTTCPAHRGPRKRRHYPHPAHPSPP